MEQNTELIRSAESYFNEIKQANDEYLKKHFLFHFDEDAKEFLIQNNVLKQFDKCPECGSTNIKRRKDNYRCIDCEVRWDIRKTTVLEDWNKISYTDFMKCLDFYSEGDADYLITDKMPHIYVSRLLDEFRKRTVRPMIQLPDDGESDIYLGLEKGKINLHITDEPKFEEYIHLKLICSEEELTNFIICRIQNGQIIGKRPDELDKLQDLIGKRLSLKLGEYLDEIIYYFSDLINRYNDPSAYQHMNLIKKIPVVN